MLTVMVFAFGVFGAVYYCTLELQSVLGFDPLATGGAPAAAGRAVFVGAGVTGPLTHPPPAWARV